MIQQIMRAVSLCCAICCTQAYAQQPLDDETITQDAEPQITVEGLDPVPNSPQVMPASGAVLRVLDKFSGDVIDVSLQLGNAAAFGHIDVILRECRYPTENPAGDAYAFVDIIERGQGTLVFSGWMIASAPALNALDHARYDVWVMRCITS